jgi:predicted GNAT family acetyltransferase
MTTEAKIKIADHPEEHRYELRVDGELAAIAEYHDAANLRVRTFTHTLVHALFEGRGLATRLADAVLDDARAKGLRVLPLCPFIAAHIAAHSQYADLVAS